MVRVDAPAEVPARTASSLTVRTALRQLWDYLEDRFPLETQGVAVVGAYICCSLLFDGAVGHRATGWTAVAGAVAMVLLFLQRRIVDDIDDLPKDLAKKGLTPSSADGRRRRRTLSIGCVSVSALAIAVAAVQGLAVAADAFLILVWSPLAVMVIRGRSRSVPVRVVVNETVPAALLTFPLVSWEAAAGRGVPLAPTLWTLGTFWLAYEFWNVSRKLGSRGFDPWGLARPSQQRVALIALAGLSAACAIGLVATTGVPASYLLFGIGIPLAAVVLAARGWPSEDEVPLTSADATVWWAGLPYPAAVQLGVAIGLVLRALLS